MPTVTATPFYCLSEDIAEKVHNLGSDTLKVVLSNSAPSQSNTGLTDITQIANGNGYTTGGSALTISSSGQSSGNYILVLADLVFTASGGAMADFRYVVFYNDTSTGDRLLWYFDMGATISLASGQTFTIDHGAITGAFVMFFS